MKITFDQAIEEYLKYSKLKLKKSTIEEQERKVKKYILSYFENKNIYEFDIKDIISWKEYIENFNFKYHYKSYLYYSMTSIFDFLVKFYNVEKNYARIEGNFKNDDIDSEGNIWTIKEFNQFMKVINNPTHTILFKLLFFTGMRKGELLALKWTDIDFNNRVININKTITRNHEFQTPKTHSSNRKISINRNITKELLKLKQQSDNELIFNISFTQLKRIKDNYCDKANLKKIKIHEFRHSHACYLFTNKIEIKDISYRLGHSNIGITMSTYLKYLPRNEKRVIHLLNSNCMIKLIQNLFQKLDRNRT